MCTHQAATLMHAHDESLPRAAPHTIGIVEPLPFGGVMRAASNSISLSSDEESNDKVPVQSNQTAFERFGNKLATTRRLSAAHK
jgi:hypothetical protein